MAWYQETGPLGQSVLSSRIRLARNLEGVAFPQALAEGDLRQLNQSLATFFMESQTREGGCFEGLGRYRRLRLDQADEVTLASLVEKRFISPSLARSPAELLLRDDEAVSIMLGEEDHFRLQAMAAGFDLEKPYEAASALARELERRYPLAYESQLGYLTACPSNLGTGMRASVLLHLPLLSLETGRIDHLSKDLERRGFALRGAYGEGSRACGALYQLSNQVTLGLTEARILQGLQEELRAILATERALEQCFERLQLEDRVWRSRAILSEARLMTEEEARRQLSDWRLGIRLGVFPESELGTLARVQDAIGVASLQKVLGRPLEAFERDQERATYLRETMSALVKGQ